MIPTQERPFKSVFPQSKFAYLAALRPHQWTKNLIVFAAPLFAFQINWQSAQSALVACATFCALSSSFYLLNDLLDAKADRQHPIKRYRPIASGQVKPFVALAIAILLLISALTGGGWQSQQLMLVLFSYALLQIAYNFKLKRLVLLDVIAIAAGFVLRAYGGAVATHVVLSPWFVLCTAMLALFLAIEKRKAELRLAILHGKTRAVLGRYSQSLLSRMESTVTTGVVTAYTLWSSGPQVRGASTPWMLLTLPFVLHGLFRYQLLSDPAEIARKQQLQAVDADQAERPEDALLKDLPLGLTVLSWVAVVFIILWLKAQGWIE